MQKLFFALLIVLMLGSNSILAQAPISDAGSWNTCNLSIKLPANFSFVATQEIRFRENYSRLNLFYTNLGIEYKVNNAIKTSLVYRWINKFQDDNSFSFRNRLMWDITYKYEYGKWYASYRHRLQVEKRNIYTSENGKKFVESFSRNKFEIGYAINKKITLYINNELRYQIHDPRNVWDDMGIRRSRYVVGVDYALTKKIKLGSYYLIQHEFNAVSPENLYITGLECSFSF